MALRCWAHVLSRDACIARAIAAALPGAKLHTDVCLLQDGAYTSDGPPAAAPSSEQPSHSQQQSRPSNFRQQYGGAVRLNSSSQSAPGASVSGRGPGYQQAQGSASQGRPPQGPDRHQRFGGQHPDSRQAGPASPSQHSGTVRQPGSFFQASGRVTQSNFPNSGPTANNRFTRPGPDARQQTDWPPYQQQSQPRYQQGGSQYPPNNQNDQRFPGRTILRSSDRSSSPQQGFQRRPQTGPMGRQVPAQANMDPEDVEEQGNPPRRRKAAFGKRITPSSSQSEQPALPPKMRGTASRAQGPPVSLQDDEEAATRMQQDGELDIVPESYLERSQNNVRGVPASWRDELEDEEDKEDLEEARIISGYNRRRMNGEIQLEEDEMKDEIHAVQMNLDPRLDFGIGAPRMSEAAPPNAEQLLEASKGHLSHMLDIENEEEWQALTEGLAEDFEDMNQLIHQRFVKPKVLEAFLEQYVAQEVPQDHPMSPVILQSMQMLQHNPDWNFRKKCYYMQRLIKELM